MFSSGGKIARAGTEGARPPAIFATEKVYLAFRVTSAFMPTISYRA